MSAQVTTNPTDRGRRPRVPGAPRLVVLVITPAVAEDVAAEGAAAGAPRSSRLLSFHKVSIVEWLSRRPGGRRAAIGYLSDVLVT